MTTPKKPSQLAALRERIGALEKEVERLKATPPVTIYHWHQWPNATGPYPYYYPQQPYITCGGLGVGTSGGTLAYGGNTC